MSQNNLEVNRRILAIDDNPAVHEDIRKVLCVHKPQGAAEIERLESTLFGSRAAPEGPSFEIDSAAQGKEGVELVQRALAEGRPYAMAFVDMRMPPGMDGLETIAAIWRIYPDLEVVICTAYSDYDVDAMFARLGATDQLLVLKKPFDTIEVSQAARALTEKWSLRQEARVRTSELERRVATRTRELSKANAQLVAELGSGKRSVEGVGRLAAGLSGELKRALESLPSTVGRAGAGDPDLKALLTSAAQGAKQMSSLLQGLEKTGAGSSGERVALDLNDTLSRVLDLVSEGIHGCAELKTDLGALPLVECAPSDIGLVLLGLVDNAIQAVEEAKERTGKQGLISISTHLENDSAVIAISDSGAGVPAEARARLFEPFYVWRSGDHNVAQGLSAAWAVIVDEHHGQLSLASEPGHGSTFSVRLPVHAGVGSPTARA